MKKVIIIDVYEFDTLVQNTYGKPYSFRQQDDCKDRGLVYITVPCKEEDYDNDTILEEVNGEEMGVSFNAWLERDVNKPVGENYNKRSIETFWERNFYPDVSMIVNDLYKKELLNAGKYAIEIDW